MRRGLNTDFTDYTDSFSIKDYEVSGGESACFVASWECICAKMA